jgi:hypothetical protein
MTESSHYKGVIEKKNTGDKSKLIHIAEGKHLLTLLLSTLFYS